MSCRYADNAFIMKALVDETRLKIIDMLSCGELCACEILEHVEITQPTLSYHMKILTDSGLVNGKRDGAWMYYSLNSENINQLLNFLNILTKPKEDCICNSCKEKPETKCDSDKEPIE